MHRGRHALAIISLFTAGYAPASARSQPTAPVAQDLGWITNSPAEEELDETILQAVGADLREGRLGNIHSLLVGRHGRLVFEAYATGADQRWGELEPYRSALDPDELHDLRSVTKTIVSTLVGLAIADGYIPSVDTPLQALLPDHAHLFSEATRSLTLEHLLTMSAGFSWDESSMSYRDPRNDERRMTQSADPIAFVLQRDMAAQPGTVWNYNGGLTHLLGAIVEARTGRPIEDYAGERLFGPMGITRFEWRGDLHGMPAAASGVRLSPRGMMKLGLMFANGGRWQGRQIVPEDWLREATRPHIPIPSTAVLPPQLLRRGYGYQWWTSDYDTPQGETRIAAAVGNGGQRIYLIPRHDLVIVTTAGQYNQPVPQLNQIVLRVMSAVQPRR